MTGRILAGFLAVLLAVIAAIIVPLGITVTAQQRRDFADSAEIAARTYAGLAEERLDERSATSALAGMLATAAAPGDRIAVLDRAGRLVAAVGKRPPPPVLRPVRAGRHAPSVEDALVTTVPVRDAERHLGTVVLMRETEPVDDRARTLWLALAAAAAAALLLGAAVGWSLARWITRPLRSLAAAAHGIGAGRPATRADDSKGPVQVRDVAHAFNDMADRVTALVQMQRGMTAEVSHQLRTPLAALRLRLELMLDEVDDTIRDDVTALLTETNRLARLVDGLLAVARAEAIESAPAPTDVVRVVTERIEAWQPVAAERDVTIGLCTTATPAVAAATPGNLEQILDNLFANAVEAVPPEGRIDVAVHRDGAAIRISVDDTGPGMTAEQRAHAFDPFTTDRGGRGGTGLGLAIVGRLVATDHGRATLQPRPGGGTRAEISVPAVAEVDATARRRAGGLSDDGEVTEPSSSA